MTTTTVGAGVDTWANSSGAGKNYAKTPRLRVAQNTKAAYVRLKAAIPRGATIVSAQLVLTSSASFTGTVTLSAQRISTGWTASRLTWTNRPTGSVGSASSAGAKTNPAANTQFVFDVTADLQAIVLGAANNGWRITSNHNTQILLRSMNSDKFKPYLKVVWTAAPQAPSVLRPSFGRVSVTQPTLSCDFTDHLGATDMNAIQVQINTSTNFTAPFYDSGAVAAERPLLSLASVPNTVAPNSGVLFSLNTSQHWWRVRVQDGAGLWSQWSDLATLWRTAPSTVTITNPAISPNNFVTEFTPPINWTTTGTQTHYQVLIWDTADLRVPKYDTGKIKSTDLSVPIRRGILADTRSYTVEVRSWDTVTRESTVGAPVYASAQRTFTVNYSAGVAAPTSVVAAVSANKPWVDLTWQRSVAPDSWTILRDGVAIEADIDSGDPFVSGTSYAWRDWTARPGVSHVYTVKAEVNGVLNSAASSSSAVTPKPVGTWLIDPVGDTYVLLGGMGFAASSEDDAETYKVLGSAGVVRSVMGVNGLMGKLDDMMLRTREGMTWLQYETVLLSYKGRPADEFRLVVGDLNIPVILGDITVVPHQDTQASRTLKSVSCSWWQVDEFGFEVIG